MSIWDDNNCFVQQGWQCPICKRVYAPGTIMCLYCGNEKEHVSTTYHIEWPYREKTTAVEGNERL